MSHPSDDEPAAGQGPLEVDATQIGRAPRRPRQARAEEGGELSPLRKPVNTLALVPKSQKITSLARKSWNVLLHEAQGQGLDRQTFSAPLSRIIRGVDFESNDHALIKKHLRAMVSTTVEWQSPTTGEGAFWTVSGLLAHATLSKVRGEVWVEWSYAVNMRQELLQPSVFARLSMQIVSQLRSHAGMALYEICARYKDIGRTARQSWHWWRPVLMGRPETEKSAKMEYRIFKRDCLRLAVAEVCAITDLDVELVEYKSGRFISELQFLIRPKPQQSLALQEPPQPVDLRQITRAGEMGIDARQAEALIDEYGHEAFRQGLDALERRAVSAYPEPLRDPYRYLKALMPGQAQALAAERLHAKERADPTSPSSRDEQARRHAGWVEEWRRRRRERIVAEIAALPAHAQLELVHQLQQDMDARNVHPTIRRRLQTSGWQHQMVVGEMVRLYAQATLGEGWEQPSPDELLQIAAEMTG